MTDTGEQQAVVVRHPDGGFASMVVGLVLRPARASTPQRVALVLLALLALGPIAAAIAVLSQADDPTETLLEADEEPPADGVRVVATVLAIDAVDGQAVLRIDPDPGADLAQGGVLRREVEIRTNALTGPAQQVLAVGTVPAPYEITVPLSGGKVSRYPFDGYDAGLLVLVGVDGAAVPVQLAVDAVTLDHDVGLVGDVVGESEGGLVGVSLRAERRWTTTVYAVGVMALMWLFAVAGVLVSWSAVIWRVEPPIWVYGFFVGVLFALPPLRASMPGNPPPGTIVDVVAFYWSVAVVAVTLLLLLATWLRETKAKRGQAGDVTPPSELR